MLLRYSLLAFFVLVATDTTLSRAAEKRPNILFIIVDDQSPFDLQVYNSRSTLQTPHINRLAAEGVVFDSAYQMGSWSGAVCTASRHMIMTGRTIWHANSKVAKRSRKTPSSEPQTAATPSLSAEVLAANSLPAVFNAAGYDTMRTCKKGNSFEGANKLFTVRKDATRRGASDEQGSTWHAEQVLDYLGNREATQDKDPFLIYFGFSHPHDTRDGRPELLEKYGSTNHRDKKSLPLANDNQPLLPVNYLPSHPFNNTHMNVRDEVNVSGVWKNRDEATIRNEIGRQFACSENIDIQIGRVLEKLQAMGELDNTIVFYTADHGMAIGRHGLQGKQNLYEHTWRVPMVVSGPGIATGKRKQGNIYLLDVLSTLCDMAKIQAPQTNEGKSFLPVLTGEQDTVRETLFGAYSGGAKPGMRALRQGDWKLIQYESASDGVQEVQLFNLAENPHEFLAQHADSEVVSLTGQSPSKEQVNLASDKRYADKLLEMQKLLASEMRRLEDPHPMWNSDK